MSARKSMTVRFFIHLIAKRAEAIALLDSGATENFMNLSYAKWLKLPIKQLPKPRKLFNVDGTENRSGDLRHYTILNVRTGSTTVQLQFFLSDLGEHKAILGYPWFAAMQPKIDWKRGWIDHTHLPIPRRERRSSENTKTLPTPPKSLQRKTISEAPGPFNLGSRHRTPPRRTSYPSRKVTPPHPIRNTRDTKVCRRTPDQGHHPRIVESLRRKFLLRQKEGREASPGPRLPTNQSMDAKKS